MIIDLLSRIRGKQLLAVLLAAVLLTQAPFAALASAAPDADGPAAVSAQGASAQEYVNGIYSYEVVNGKAVITDCDEWATGSITIPSTLGGYTVTEIDDYAFYYRSITGVTIPDTVKRIGKSAFEYAKLTSAKIGNGVTEIDTDAFANCYKLSNLTIGSSVQTIGNAAFYSSIITSVTIPNSVTSMGDYAFGFCGKLTGVTIGSGVSYIGEGAFYACNAVVSYSVNSGNSYFSSDGYGVLYNKSKTELIAYPAGNTRTGFTVPSSVKSIGYAAFRNSKNLSSVTIPDSVNTIGKAAFQNCTELTGTVGNNASTIGESAFRNCTKITGVQLGNNVASIGELAFYACKSLESITVSTGNAYLCSEDGVLFNKAKTALIQYPAGNARTEYTVPVSVRTIRSGAFAQSQKLKVLTIANGTQKIEWGALEFCPALEQIHFPNTVTELCYCNIRACNALKNVELPSSITRIEHETIGDCKSLEYVHIPASVTFIDYRTYGCSLLGGTSAYICSETSNCYAKTFADAHNKTFRLCGGHAPTVTVTFDPNGGTGGPEYQSGSGSVTLSSNEPARRGYIFLGWAASSSAASAQYQPGQTLQLSGDLTLYAVWVYNENPAQGDVNGDGKISLVDMVLVNNEINGNGDLSAAERERADLNHNGMIDADDWDRIASLCLNYTYVVNYIGNGGSGVPQGQSGATGYITLSSVRPTRSGYTFLGWATSRTATSAQYQPGASFYLSGTTVLYAVWQKTTQYTLTYNANGGTGGPGSQTGSGTITLSSSQPSRTGYTFLGWSTSSSATSASYTAGGSFNLTKNTTLYAVWKAITYSVKFNGNGATSGSMSNQTFTYDVAQNLTANAFTRAYTVTYSYNGATGGNSAYSSTAYSGFNGWATSASGAKVYNDKASVKNLLATSGTYNLYANWTAGTVTLPTPTKSGSTFAGWYTNASLTNYAGAAGAKYTPTANTTLYAKWTTAALTSIVVTKTPNKTQYYVGQRIDPTGLTVTATYADGSTKNVTNALDETPNMLLTASGTKTVIVSYTEGGVTKKATFTVSAKYMSCTLTAPSSITVQQGGQTAVDVSAAVPDDAEWIVDLKINIANTSILSYYGACTSASCSLWFKGLREGSTTVEVSLVIRDTGYVLKTVQIPATVTAPKTLSSIAVKTMPTKTTYYVGESFDPSGLTLTATYSDGSTQTITSGFSCSGFSSTTAGTKTITVSYEGKTTTFTLPVVSAGSRVPGDVDENGQVTLRDAALISRYLAGGWNVTINTANADVDASGSVTLRDAALISRYLAGGWNVELI